MHEHAHDERRESRGDIHNQTGMPLRSLRLGLIGQADVVEFHRQADGSWQPYPVEYKLGKPKKDNTDKVQLCAQALCLEEMLHVNIREGALFYGRTKHRLEVVFDELLRQETEEIALQTYELITSGITPLPVYSKRCEKCSLVEICLPKTIQKKRCVKGYISHMLEDG